MLSVFYVVDTRAESRSDSEFFFFAKPNRCVALHQGQTCFQKISFRINTPSDDEYCLYRDSLEAPIICWQGTALTKYTYKFKSAESENFHVKNSMTLETIASSEIRIAWVYKSKKKLPSGWRLF